MPSLQATGVCTEPNPSSSGEKRKDREELIPMKLLQYLELNLSADRFQHSKRVAEMAVMLAERHGGDPEKANFAGITHDLAKEMGTVELLKKAEEFGKIKYEVEVNCPDLLHGPVGAAILRQRFGIEDESILRAVAHHTTGAPGMGKLEKILYLADFVEVGRDFPGVGELRELAFFDLGKGMLAGINLAMVKVLSRRRSIHPLSVEAWNWILGDRNEKGGQGWNDYEKP